ncbi:hypothetical protein GCM10010094_73490 [Streptomyces flaveus]|uniref:Uncharacterized protein n=1 Tax=Streptomyces flaveus TaxID=66370 RepID=A0A917RED9_9ACTN|nr:hypothetical protein GCM10010094_73490 [Streptomyces flaveus]
MSGATSGLNCSATTYATVAAAADRTVWTITGSWRHFATWAAAAAHASRTSRIFGHFPFRSRTERVLTVRLTRRDGGDTPAERPV